MRQAVTLAGSEPDAPYSEAIVSGDLVFLSGQASLDPATHAIVGTTIVEQTEGTLRNIATVLAAAGCSLGDVVKVNAYLADIADFDAFSATYARFFDTPRPARTTVGAGLTGILVEIDCVARIPAARKA